MGKVPALKSRPHPAMETPKLALKRTAETIQDLPLRVDTPRSMDHPAKDATLLVEESTAMEGMVVMVVMVTEGMEEVMVVMVMEGMEGMEEVMVMVVEVMVVEVMVEGVMSEVLGVMEVDTSTRIEFLALTMVTVLVMEAVGVEAALHFIRRSHPWAYLHLTNPKDLATLQQGQRVEVLWPKWL